MGCLISLCKIPNFLVDACINLFLVGNLFPVSQEGFAQLQEENRFSVILELVDQCTTEQKLRFQDKLKSHLSRDFLTLLPVEIVHYILSYIDVKDLITGLQVCRGWQQRITEAKHIWKAATRKIGLSESVVSAKLPEYGSLVYLTVAALKHRNFISSSAPTMITIPGSGCIDDRFEYCWAGNGISYGCLPLVGNRLLIDIVLMSDSLSPLSSRRLTKVPSDLQPTWAVAIGRKCIIWRNSDDNCWVKCNLDTDSDLQVWREQPDIQSHFTDICEECGLITSVCVDVPVGAQFARIAIKTLVSEQNSPIVTYCQLKIPKCLLKINDSVAVSEVETFTRKIPFDKQHKICEIHRLIVRFQHGGNLGTSVLAEYHIPTNISAAVEIEPIQTLQPVDAGNWSFFQRSTDGTLVSMVDTETCTHHIWELEAGGTYHIVDAPVECTCCLAVEHLYSVLQCENSVKVVVTYTGDVIFSCSFQLLKFMSAVNPTIFYPKFWPPLDLTWMNDFNCYQKDLWHIVAVNTGVDGPTKFRFIVGVRSK